jgi:hypothetical protein
MTTVRPFQAAPQAPASRPAAGRGPAGPTAVLLPTRGRRTLAGYLVMPRPGDAVKALLMPLTFGLGVLANGGTDGRTLLRAALVLAVLELLIYPARYQWNDVRGFAADQRHPGEADRGRLPGPPSMARPHILASSVAAAIRVGGALLVAALPGLGLGGVVIAVILGVFGVAGAYEALRDIATGRDGGVTPPVRPGMVLLWITVGAGYVIRGMAGLSLAVNLRERPALAVAAAVTLWAYGVAFVTSRWAVESLAFARLREGRVSWAADASHAREHLLALTRWLPSSLGSRPATECTGTSLTGWAVLRGRTPLSAPWNLALVATGAAAALTGLLLTASTVTGAAWAVAVIGGLASLAAAVLPKLRPLLVAVGAVGLLTASLIGSAPHPLVVPLPWLLAMVAYLHFSAQSLSMMGHVGQVARSAVKRALTPIARGAIGQDTWQLFTTGGSARG